MIEVHITYNSKSKNNLLCTTIGSLFICADQKKKTIEINPCLQKFHYNGNFNSLPFPT